jgi:tetratricopeptide (TPR) repeat protein
VRDQFSGTRRFKVIRKLGEGGMGIVYECDDLETGSRLALKTLLFAEPRTLLRFKDEFRHFQHIHHQNLVTLGELFEEDGLWCFTMELVEGRDFLAHVRNGAAARSAPTYATGSDEPTGETTPLPSDTLWVDIDVLRDALAQLTRGLLELHEHGKIHCDVKPSNILVTNSGRVVLLDFGIAKDLARNEQLRQTDIGGTPAYMAPEQGAAMPITAAADWYAVGAVLFEALTGRLPFEGHYIVLLHEKLTRPPPDPREFAPTVPEDLALLAMRLLATKPEERPTGHDILKALGVQEEVSSARALPVSSVVESTRTDTRTRQFVGRAAERTSLEDCLHRVVRDREAVAAYIQGESGVGKTALVTHFVDATSIADASTVILAGACYEHETVPYKAVDGVIDSLSRHLKRLPHATAASLLPRHASTLAQAFPVLSRVEAFAESPLPHAEVDPLERRSRVFAALRELLGRMGDRSPLIICIDDLQWADADSLALLGDILRPPDSPALLLLATVRADEGKTDLQLPTGPTALPAGGEVVCVPRLSEGESRQLAESLSQGTGLALDVASVAREAQGYPLFLHELVRYHSTQIESKNRPAALEEAIWSRVEGLDDQSRRLLEVIALAPSPMMQATATRAAGIETADAIKHIKQLKVAHFARTTGGTRGTDLIEPYHGRTREAVRAKLSAESRRALHRRIAVIMQTSNLHEPEDLAVHWREAGDPERAADYAQRAAARAEEALAFERAAAHYRMMDGLGVVRGKARRSLLIRLGNALANAGRSQEAAGAFREAADGSTPGEARELARRAAEHLLRSGHIDEGLTELRRVLSTVALPYPETVGSAVASLLWARARLALRGLSFRRTEETSIHPDDLARMDACWAATTGLFVVDQLRAVAFHYRHLLLALSAGEPSRVVRGLALHSIATVVEGEKKRPDANRILALARSHARDLGDPYALALLEQADGTVGFLTGDWLHAIERGRVAIEQLRSTCKGVAWELATTRQNLLWSLAFTGSLHELSRLNGSNLRETLDAGDDYAAMSIRSGLPNAVWLAQDDPQRARSEADQAIAVWPKDQVFLQHLMDLVAQVGVDLYEGAHEAAVERVAATRAKLEDAGIVRVEFNRILLLDVTCRVSLARAKSAPKAERQRHIDSARKDMLQLSRERAAWGRALAAPKRASLLRLEGDPGAESAAAEAVDVLRSAHLGLYAAACARLARGKTSREFVTMFEREHVKDPDRFAQVFFPGW